MKVLQSVREFEPHLQKKEREPLNFYPSQLLVKRVIVVVKGPRKTCKNRVCFDLPTPEFDTWR